MRLFRIKINLAMNATRFFTRNTALGAILLGSLVFGSCGKDEVDPNPNLNGNTEQLQTFNLSSNASGDQVVPSVMGTGTSNFTGTYNASTNTLNYTVNYADLSGAPTSGGFFVGAAGDPGTMVGNGWTMGTGTSATGTGSYTGTMTLTDAQAADLLRGDWFYQMGTSMNSTGEVRGQISR
jgi:hypothetical protein